ncbi:MAG: hypothetical protein AAGD25_20840 [Cyanobacteria bacterium P01_F01_bin.150]
MDAFRFAVDPPEWTQVAIHAHEFCCPSCRSKASESKRVWVNRYSPVYTPNQKRKWQEFYQCECGQVWWAWSSDRPPSKFGAIDG